MAKDYKDTLNLPRTEFPMKANLPQREPQILEKWKDLYKKVREARKGREVFLLHDGPPYANGHIHVGHALNKILKDVINKYNLLIGKDILYIPGWDCHGLPIERAVEKELSKKKIKKESLPKTEFRKLCREYAERFVNIQREEFIRLGVLGDWENPYLTMTPSYEAQEIRELGKFFERGLAYRSKKPVYWCIYDKTAEAEAEVEYYEKTDPSIYVKFPIKNKEKLGIELKDKRLFAIIWTTTPWTLPANLGIMVKEDADYALIEMGDLEPGDEVWIVAKDLIENFFETVGLPQGIILGVVKGKELVGLEYEHPFVDRYDLKGHLSEETLKNIWRIYPSEFVTLDTGTGLVHMAPGHGQEDYAVGQRFGLEPYAPLTDDGRFTEPAPEFLRGVRVFDANNLIIDVLKEKGFLVYEGKIKHSYPHCWRCKNPVIFRATPQWFIGMDIELEGKTLRERALEEIEKVKWIPEYGKNRIKSMVENRPDWCISRQRYWGVPITVFYCENCGEIIKEPEVFERVAQLVENSEHGTDVWFELSPAQLLPEGYKCPKCGGEEFRKEEDILDVWFDSGSSHAAVIRPLGFNKADLYLEGSDQHRGWFQASLLESVGSYLEAPYKAVLTHGFIVDEKGRKMSKSLGNVISPQEVIQEFGADILRLWVVSEDYTEDVKLGKQLLKKIAEDYRKVRNTLRFIIGNLYDFDPKENAVPFKELHHFDRWIISELQKILEQVHKHYQEYLFYRVHNTIKNFIITELSAIYLDVLKDRLYVYAPDSWERRSAQTALWHLLIALTTTIAPYLSFTAEELWEHVRKLDPTLPESVFLYEIPKPDKNLVDEEVLRDYEKLLKLRDEVMRVLEVARKEKGIVKHPYEAKVFVKAEGELKELIEKYRDYMNFFLTVSQFELGEGGEVRDKGEELPVEVGVSPAEGEKCPRCWIYYPKEEFIGEVCRRCAEALEKVQAHGETKT